MAARTWTPTRTAVRCPPRGRKPPLRRLCGRLEMAFEAHEDNDEVMNEINMTPLVDVMLVLLIIFIITVPVIQHAVKVELPQASSQREQVKPETLRLSVDASGLYYLNGTGISDDELPARLQTE